MKCPTDEGRSGGELGASRCSTSFEAGGGRQRFTVELRPGETTIVSWKKLLKETTFRQPKNNGPASHVPSSSEPAAELQPPLPQPHNQSSDNLFPQKQPDAKEAKDPPPGNRLNAVIEKIERLYVGKQSDDEEDLDDVPDEDEYDTDDSFIDDTELDDYFQVDDSAIKHDGFFVNRGKLERIEPTVQQNQQPNKRRKKDQTKGLSLSDDGGNTNKHAKVGKKARKLLPNAAGASNHSHGVVLPTLCVEKTNVKTQDANLDLQNSEGHLSRKVVDKLKEGFETSNKRGGKSGIDERLTMISVPDGKKSTQSAKKDGGSNVRSKISALEKAIRDLEKIVTELRPPMVEVQDGDNASQSIKRRLPLEIKQKLAKVARYAQASHGKVSKELLNRLMSIVGHLIQLRTLKRNLKIMILTGLSAKQEKDNQVLQIKKEVAEMVKIRIPLMKSKAIEQQAGTSDDFQAIAPEEKEAFKRKYCMDNVLEDKICDLYDLYVEGLEEDAGPQVRKLYAELAAYWPNGFMDNHGIKRAICRAKDRKKSLHNRHKSQEKVRKNKMSGQKEEDALRVDTTAAVAAATTTTTTTMLFGQPVQNQEKLAVDAKDHSLTATNKPTVPSAASVTSAIQTMPISSQGGIVLGRPIPDKAKGTSDRHIAPDGLKKKKMKRKMESELIVDRPENRYQEPKVIPPPPKPIPKPIPKPMIELNGPPSFEEEA
ncbi:unnamed protein product [Cuscuta campestris]|uniref:Hpc2-related domain-containing protein n=1 Tax=Cuscuta campestris TaxID=132261 RepID=A0A484NG83_9ASTE|nr:unnamed protein product [Cuscuta campestris]